MKVLGSKDFEAQVGSQFEPAEDSEAPALELIEVKRVGPKEGVDREQFSLLFQSQTGEIYPQNTYAFRHKKLGELSVFLAPIGQNDAGVQYEAVFA